ncbi:MAG: hypothetical protein HW380_867 [Magnetococcales bacterium]|nr:hypothetical protein [Magnetococcales bacterium]
MQALATRIDARSKNERIYLLLAVLVVLGAGWNALVREPFLKKQKEIKKEAANIADKIKNFESIERQILVRKDIDINLRLKETFKQKQEDLDKLERSLKSSARNFLSPGEMTQALKRMLIPMADVTLLNMESIPGEGVHLKDIQKRFTQAVDEKTEKATENKTNAKNDKKKLAKSPTEKNPLEDDDVTMFRHGLNVTLAGNFLAVMHYLQKIESLPWTFYWGGLDFVATEKGTAETKLFLSTMSFSDGYIGTDPNLNLTAEQLAMMNQEKTEKNILNDPTIPGESLVEEAEAASDEAKGKESAITYHLQSILNSERRKVAIINGRVLTEKESLGDMTVLSINPMSVHILQGKQQQELFLKSSRPWVNKHLIVKAKP